MPDLDRTKIKPRNCRHCGRPYVSASRRTVHCSDPCRFWSKVDQSNAGGCWPYLAGIRKGYGIFFAANYGRSQQAHRVAFALSRGAEIPAGMDVLHSCDNRSCCNPAHLRLGTDVENARDRVDRGRHAFGSRSGTAKLTETDVIRIRREIRTGAAPVSMAREYGVSTTTIYSLRNEKTWRMVSDAPSLQTSDSSIEGIVGRARSATGGDNG